MFIKNNSSQTWEDYHCGGGYRVTIKPGQVIEVPDAIGRFLIRMLGSDNWLVETEKPVVEKKPAKKEEEKPKVRRTSTKKSK